MRKILHITVITLLLLCSTLAMSQEKTADPDAEIKEMLYNKYKKEVRSYDKKDFDDLFMSFFESQNGEKVLTKEEFYTYTIKIALYSEKLGLLYKSQKAESDQAKKEWYDKSYQDYLNSKKN